jgi:hypothetical protein
MRLRVHTPSANEELVALVNEGYEAISIIMADYRTRKVKGTFDDSKDVEELIAPVNTWANKVVESLGASSQHNLRCTYSWTQRSRSAL